MHGGRESQAVLCLRKDSRRRVADEQRNGIRQSPVVAYLNVCPAICGGGNPIRQDRGGLLWAHLIDGGGRAVPPYLHIFPRGWERPSPLPRLRPRRKTRTRQY